MHLRTLMRWYSPLRLTQQCDVQKTVKELLHGCNVRSLTTSPASSPAATDFLRIADEVSRALNEQEPVVALESTIITHGMPYPHNVQTAQEVEEVVRQNGSVPATIAIISGKIHVGLSDAELHWLGSEAKASKASRRDLAYLLSQGLSGGTTVSCTMIAAHLAGITLFVTGGIGGVHRDVEHTLDVSADLRELGRTPVTVISAGVKSILDIPRTLEYLETEGVGVFTYGPTTDFPAFFTPRSGSLSPYNIQTPVEAAKLIATSQSLGLQSGNLIAVPVPSEAAADPDKIQTAIDKATREATSQKVKGKEVTPFVLQRVNELMKGASLKTNIALIKNNAKVGSQIAVALAGLHRGHLHQGQPSRSYSTYSHSTKETPGKYNSGRMVVVGGINIDFTASFGDSNILSNGDTYHGSIRQSIGGVGRNIADGLTRLGQNPLFLSAIGTDSYAKLLEMECGHMDLSHVRKCRGSRNATYCAILDHQGALINGIGDFDIHSEIDRQYLSGYAALICTAPLVLFDGNIPPDSMAYLTELCHQHDIPVFFEPTTASHVQKLFASNAWRRLTYTSPNMVELRMLHAGVTSGDFTPVNAVSSVETNESDTLEEVIELCKPLIEYIPYILTTIGRHGAVLVRNTGQDGSTRRKMGSEIRVNKRMSALHIPVAPSSCEDIVSVSGAGDCLVAAFMTSLLQKEDLSHCLARGVIAANMSLQSHVAVPSSLTVSNLDLLQSQDQTQWHSKLLHCH